MLFSLLMTPFSSFRSFTSTTRLTAAWPSGRERADRELTFTWDESLVDYLVDKAYSVTYGARNLRRVLEQDVEDPISEKIIDSFEAPIEAISASAENGKVVVEAK